MVKKKNGKLTMNGFRPIAMLPTMYRLYSKVLLQLAGQAIHTRYGPQYGHVPGRQAHEVVFILRRMVEQANGWRIPIFVMDCDVAAAFTTSCPSGVGGSLDQRVQELRNAHRLDDNLTQGIRRTRSVPQGDPCAASLFEAPLDVPATVFSKVPGREVGDARGWQIHGATAFCRQLLAPSCVASGTPMRGSCMERTAGMR